MLRNHLYYDNKKKYKQIYFQKDKDYQIQANKLIHLIIFLLPITVEIPL